MRMSKNKIAFAFFLLFLFPVTFSNTFASVTMLGTRIIYHSDIKEKSLEFTNNGDDPVLVQVWTDKNNPHSTAETADAPFIVMPSIFRIDASAEHTLRLKFTGVELPQDRESLFWLNFLQYPAKKASEQGKNRFTMLVKSRIKILYRPATLHGNANKSLDDLRISLHGKTIEVNNTSPWHISFISAVTEDGRRQIPVKLPGMIPPYSTEQWALPAGAGKTLTIKAINDYGGVFRKTYPLIQ